VSRSPSPRTQPCTICGDDTHAASGRCVRHPILTEQAARDMLNEHLASCPRKRSGRGYYVLSADERSLSVYRLTPSGKRAVYQSRIRLDEPTARYLMPLDVLDWVRSRTGKVQ
jgi:hypothetical protein